MLTACGPRDATYAPSGFAIHDAIAPRDVAVPGGLSDIQADYDGLYTGGPQLLSCCWIAPHAALLVRKHGPARTLVAGFWVPDNQRFAHGQRVTISFPHTGAKPRQFKLDRNNQSWVTVPVPAALRKATGLIPVTLDCAIDYVPARDNVPHTSLFTYLHLRPSLKSQDERELGVVLMYLYFE